MSNGLKDRLRTFRGSREFMFDDAFALVPRRVKDTIVSTVYDSYILPIGTMVFARIKRDVRV